MPSTRWLLFAVIAVYTWKNSVIAAETSDQLPVASNGWRPIIGTHDVKSYITNHDQKQNTAANVKQTISLTTGNHDNKNNNEKTNKVPVNQHIKGGHANQLHINHHGSTGHHNKFHSPSVKPHHKPTSHGNIHIMGAGKPALRHPVLNKLHAHMNPNAKRNKPSKPFARPQHSSHPVRDEMMVQEPSSAIGTYTYFNQGPLHIQNSPLSNKPFLSAGPHVDFSNHFAFSNINNDVVLPQTHFNFPKHPSQNELQSNQFVYVNQNDEFTRNLVPPPPLYKPQGEKESVVIKEPPKIVDQPTTNNAQFVVSKQKDEIRHIPENLLVQLPPPYSHFQHSLNKPLVDLEITKENFKEYHTTLAPLSYQTSTESYIPDATKFSKPQSIITPHHTYEVTEEKEWPPQIFHFKPIYSSITPTAAPASIPSYKVQISTAVPEINKYHFSQQITHPQNIMHGPTGTHFLPTPYNPGNAFPTSPTQVDVSTIYTEISQLKKKRPMLPAPSPTSYNLKEVSTHFPVYELRKPDTQISIPTGENGGQYLKGKVTDKPIYVDNTEVETTTQYVRPIQKTTYPTRPTSPQRRPNHRRRRPTRPTTTSTTESYEPYETHDNSYIYDTENVEVHRTTEKAYRRRRPPKYRTTESPETQSTSNVENITKPTTADRYKPTRPRPQTITEEIFESKYRYRPIHKQHKYTEEEEDAPANNQNDNNEHTTSVSPKFEKAQDEYERDYDKPDEAINDYRNEQDTTEPPYTDYKYLSENIPETTESVIKPKNKRKRIRPYSTTTEILPSTNLKIPENELDYTTLSTNDDPAKETITIKEVYDYEKPKPFTTLLTTLPTTTTTTETPTTSTKTNRIRQRPLKYEVQRPRFSVRDYRLRLNQYMSTSTEQPRTSTESSRVRYSNRFKTSTINANNEESTESIRQRFIPKEPRRRQPTTESSDISSTEKYIKTVNTRLRPFGRYRSSTEAPSTSTTVTSRVSIRPNIFNNLKRPQNMNLRTRIYNKKRNETQSTTETYNQETGTGETTNTAKTEVTIPFEPAESTIEVTTQFYKRKFDTESTIDSHEAIEENTMKPSDVIENIAVPEEAETFLQLQRISDLTSSAHKQYNTPGSFKSVSPTSRRVPSYFTIATEDPILPIEAFFPNLNKNTEKQM